MARLHKTKTSKRAKNPLVLRFGEKGAIRLSTWEDKNGEGWYPSCTLKVNDQDRKASMVFLSFDELWALKEALEDEDALNEMEAQAEACCEHGIKVQFGFIKDEEEDEAPPRSAPKATGRRQSSKKQVQEEEEDDPVSKLLL